MPVSNYNLHTVLPNGIEISTNHMSGWNNNTNNYNMSSYPNTINNSYQPENLHNYSVPYSDGSLNPNQSLSQVNHQRDLRNPCSLITDARGACFNNDSFPTNHELYENYTGHRSNVPNGTSTIFTDNKLIDQHASCPIMYGDSS